MGVLLRSIGLTGCTPNHSHKSRAALKHAFSKCVVGSHLPLQEPDAHEQMFDLVQETSVESASTGN